MLTTCNSAEVPGCLAFQVQAVVPVFRAAMEETDKTAGSDQTDRIWVSGSTCTATRFLTVICFMSMPKTVSRVKNSATWLIRRVAA